MADQFKSKKMYYNRKLTDSFSALIEPGGALRWLFDFVKNHKELDFQIGKNNRQQWISVYRGTSRIVKILKTSDVNKILVEGAPIYKDMGPLLFGPKTIPCNFKKDLEDIIGMIKDNSRFNRYYKNEKEGFYQNILSRRFGMFSLPTDDFVIIDKEAVIGYENQFEKTKFMGPFQEKYKILQKEISALNPKLYGKNIETKAIGNELDFLALDKDGNILLIEYKYGTNASGIYLSPLQIGMYYDIFTHFDGLSEVVFEMLAQKQKIGLINPEWIKPPKIREIIPVLIISGYNLDSTAKNRFNEIMKITQDKLGSGFLYNLKKMNFTESTDLSNW